MNVDHRELRAAIERFLAAKRAARQAYRRTVASHGPAELRPMLEGGTPERAQDDPSPSQELEGLKEENGRLRKSLALLHAHSLRIQDKLDALLLHWTESTGGGVVIAPSMREDPRGEPRNRAGRRAAR